MSPLAQFLMIILRNGSFGAAALLLLFVGIEIFKHITPEGHLVMTRQDWSFIAVLGVLIFLAFYLVRSISKELSRPGE
jgi:hypothetical protein